MPQSCSPEEKAAILRQHFVGKRPVSVICEEYGIRPGIFRQWETTLFENGELVFRQFPRDGTDYFQNYDFVFNWLSEVFRGQTLEVLGVRTGEIRRVCSYKPAEIAVSTGVLDVVFEDVSGNAWHVEEQRNMSEDDLCRFASQHFSATKEWRENITDIILISGRPYTGRREIRTPSGTYAPVITDLTERDARTRLGEIREAAAGGDASVFAELVFLPLYGRSAGGEQSRFVRELVHFETELWKQEKMPATIIAATLIMANKQIDKSTFQELWEEIKMLNILKFAHEKGWEEGQQEGWQKGRIETAREMVIASLEESFGVVPTYIADEIMSLSRQDVLRALLKQAVKCREISEFEKMLRLASKKAEG